MKINFPRDKYSDLILICIQSCINVIDYDVILLFGNGALEVCYNSLMPHCTVSAFRYLSNNKITSLELGALDHLGATLQVLRLSRNRISQIPVKAFQLPRLTQL